MKNKTRFKSFNIVNDDPRVTEVFQDQDGIWLWLNPGWTADPRGAHDIHEDTVRDVLSKYRDIEPCACSECAKSAAVLEAAK